MLTRMVDCVTWNFDNQIVVGNAGLAAQSTFRLQPPRFIQHIVFFFRTFRQGVEAFTYNTVTGGAGARFLTGVFNLDAVAQRNVKNGFTGLSFQNCAIRTKILMRQNNNLRHGKPRLRNGLSTRDEPTGPCGERQIPGFVYLRF